MSYIDKILVTLSAIAQSVSGNAFGLIAVCSIFFAIILLFFVPRDSIKLRLLAIMLVFVALVALPAAAIFNKIPNEPEPRTVAGQQVLLGQFCTNDSQCNSGYCWPGPHPKPNGSGFKYCTRRDMNCALPGFDGAKYESKISLGGNTLTCKKPRNGYRAQFYDPDRF